ncbi:hypothetical protein ABMA28_009765 [Loxostege sticticalis]|uniref:Peptidase S1 domain-containing protein n=1 Tax=Loxostege sticticalis TaxID=481309 RepID=A0ABD0SBC8_LOXSC
MSWLKRRFLILFAVLHIATTDRRITGGKQLSQKKRYMVYFVRAPSSPRAYDAWLCGGALVSNQHIVTSAACVEDVQHMYAIAGYEKMVPTQNLEQDKCANEVKKKVIYTCVPKAYDFDFEKIEKWAYIDIAVAKVESPYNFGDKVWTEVCSYVPQPIRINYDKKYQKPGVDTMVMGWGHLDNWRLPSDTKDYNQKNLHYASALIYDTEKCKKFFQEIGPMAMIIEKYMICTLDSGNIDAGGNPINPPRTLVDGCSPNIARMLQGDLVCQEDGQSVTPEATWSISDVLARQRNMTRRQGICQNDHGGPLVTWVGGHEVLIGVASVFRITNDYKCTGPFLRRSELCNKPPVERGFDKLENYISWMTQPEGPADNERNFRPAENEKHFIQVGNEKIMIRPQIPLYRRNSQNGSGEITNL